VVGPCDVSAGVKLWAGVAGSDAILVADRFHLWQNPGKAVNKTVVARRANFDLLRHWILPTR
jgi:hypothetical protein